MRRRGVTLIEMVVFTGIGMFVLAGAYQFLATGIRKGVQASERLEAVAVALEASSWLERDLFAAYVSPGVAAVSLGENEDEVVLQFYRHTAKSPDTTWEERQLELLQYVYRKKTGILLRRNLTKDKEKTFPGRFSDVAFGLQKSQVQASREPFGHRVFYLFAGIREGEPSAQPSPGEKPVVQGAVPLPALAVHERFPYWHEDPYGTVSGIATP